LSLPAVPTILSTPPVVGLLALVKVNVDGAEAAVATTVPAPPQSTQTTIVQTHRCIQLPNSLGQYNLHGIFHQGNVWIFVE
jgi:hypothetical protein